jgi:hypothetical protein
MRRDERDIEARTKSGSRSDGVTGRREEPAGEKPRDESYRNLQ